MTAERSFTPKLLIGWIAVAVLCFAASVWLMSRGGGSNPGADAVGPSSFSRSAIGYAGIADILQRLQIVTVKSQYESLGKVGEDGLLVLAEPLISFTSDETFRRLLDAPRVLLILPKWVGKESEQHTGWISNAQLRLPIEADWLLQTIDDKAEILRRPKVEHWSANGLGVLPAATAPVQLVRSARLRPIVADGDAILLGELVRSDGHRLWVLADPDVMANHGLAEGANAEFAVALVEALRAPEGKVVFDETVHGYVAAPASPLGLLFRPPFVFASLQAVLALAFLLWATLARFGAAETAPPALQAGKPGLLENAAELLAFAGHQAGTTRRYLQATMRDVGQRLHAPAGLDDAALRDWLQRVGAARGVASDLAALGQRAVSLAGDRFVSLTALFYLARDIHQWKREMLDGLAGDTRHNRRHPRRSAEGGGRPG